MSRALVVFESMYGNTERIAEAVAGGLRQTLDVETCEVGAAAATFDRVELLVVGGPTHAHGMSSPSTRLSAAEKVEVPLRSTRLGIREWLAGLDGDFGSIAAAAFDTRVKGPAVLWGSAARRAAAELRRLGFHEVVPPESFLVAFSPLEDAVVPGEVERARAWGAGLAGKLPAFPGRR
jgi:hypothetical protein